MYVLDNGHRPYVPTVNGGAAKQACPNLNAFRHPTFTFSKTTTTVAGPHSRIPLLKHVFSGLYNKPKSCSSGFEIFVNSDKIQRVCKYHVEGERVNKP